MRDHIANPNAGQHGGYREIATGDRQSPGNCSAGGGMESDFDGTTRTAGQRGWTVVALQVVCTGGNYTDRKCLAVVGKRHRFRGPGRAYRN
jgi:hypothetical protein